MRGVTRIIILMVAGLILCAGAQAERRERPLFGVIRWDMYSGHPYTTYFQEFGQFLSPERYQWRAPFFVRKTGDPAKPLAFNPDYVQEPIQKAMDQEIIFASSCGVDYWVFNYECKRKDPDTGCYRTIKAYLNSPNKGLINFCITGQPSVAATKGYWEPADTKHDPAEVLQDWKIIVSEYVELMKEPTYQRVLDNRPLLYLLGIDQLAARLGDSDNSTTHARESIQYLRDQCQAAGVGNPYIVSMMLNGTSYLKEGIIDAINPYHYRDRGTPQGRPYSFLWQDIQDDYLAKTGDKKVVPPLMSGANWEPRVLAMPKDFPDWYYDEPEPGELGQHLSSGLDYVATHPEKCEANTALMYAWNEHSEGGFFCPTMGNPPDYKPVTNHIDDASRAIKNWTAPASRKTDGVVLANYAFGDRETTLASIADEPGYTASSLTLPKFAYYVPENHEVEGRLGNAVLYNVRQSAGDVFKFEVKSKSGKMDIRVLEVALKGASKESPIDLTVKAKANKGALQNIGVAHVVDSDNYGWTVSSIKFPSAFGKTNNISVEISISGKQGQAVIIDDIRLRGLVNPSFRPPIRTKCTFKGARPIKAVAGYSFESDKPIVDTKITSSKLSLRPMISPKSAQFLPADKNDGRRVRFVVTNKPEDYFEFSVKPINGKLNLSGMGMLLHRDPDSPHIAVFVLASIGGGEFKEVTRLYCSNLDVKNYQEAAADLPGEFANLDKEVTFRFRVECRVPGYWVDIRKVWLGSSVIDQKASR
ncbi:MAG: hypothetical protein ABFD54_15500 [Armatimonadota bacterium]|nr:hypothetical protein [bacterium]